MHGDNFVVEGMQSDLDWVRDVLAAKYILKVSGILGPEQEDQKSIVVLGRVVDWRAGELWWEADPKNVERILQVCGMVSGNPSVVPGVKLREEDRDEEELAGEDLTRYRSVVATANFISQDHPRCEIRGEGALSRGGQADVRQLAKVEEARQVLERSAQARAEDQARCGWGW